MGEVMKRQAWSKVMKLIPLVDRSLSECTGLTPVSRKKVTYWTLATHSLPNADKFPLLALLGRMGTGKTETLNTIGNFARKPVRVSLRGTTLAMLRDKLINSAGGTAIIEEADAAWRDTDSTFERLLSDRYSRASAEAAFKVQKQIEKEGVKGIVWQGASGKFFGATVLHRRFGFKDAALDGRTIVVRTRANNERTYREFNGEDPWNAEGREIVASELDLELPQFRNLPGIPARIQATYGPLLSLAELIDDNRFIDQVGAELAAAAAELREAQASEPDGLVLRAILFHIYSEPNPFNPEDPTAPRSEPCWANIKIGVLKKYLWDEHRLGFEQRQIAGMARELGFTTKVSHGVTVITPTAATLLTACQSCEYEDEDIQALRAQVGAQTLKVEG